MAIKIIHNHSYPFLKQDIKKHNFHPNGTDTSKQKSKLMRMPRLQTNYNVNPAGGDLTLAGGQMEDDILHMASYI